MQPRQAVQIRRCLSSTGMTRPPVLAALYELRNNRAIGHVSGDVSPNHMDAELYLRGMKWVMGEFVRNYSNLPLDDARAVVEAVTARTFHIVWSSGDVRRVLEPAKSAAQKVLIVLYAEAKPVSVARLQTWVEYKNGTDFKRKVLRELHRKALIHYDEKAATAQILPPGQTYVEKGNLLVTGEAL